MMHNEMLFVVIHQIGELGFIAAAARTPLGSSSIDQGSVTSNVKGLGSYAPRRGAIGHAWDILTTMAPPNFLTFPDRRGSASGLVSYQYWKFEFLLGAKKPQMLAPLKKEPGLHDETLRILTRCRLPVPQARINLDCSAPWEPDPSVTAVIIALYRDVATYSNLHKLHEKLVDLEHKIAIWRRPTRRRSNG
jgi:tryptophan 2,3-dioxygenase